jgi:hypothetical protein
VNLGCGSNYLDAYDLTVNGCLRVSGSGTNDIEMSVLRVAKDAVFNLCGCGNQDIFIGPEVAVGTPEGQENQVGGDLIINTSGGNDDVTESSLSVGKSNKIYTDGGNDSVNLGETVAGPDGIDYSLTVGKDLVVNLGCGCDSLNADGVRVTGTFSVVQGFGNSTIDLHNVVANAVKVTTDGGKDDVSFDQVDANSAQVLLGSGNDTFSITNSTISMSTFDGGTGVNTYTDGGGNALPNLTKKHFT